MAILTLITINVMINTSGLSNMFRTAVVFFKLYVFHNGNIFIEFENANIIIVASLVFTCRLVFSRERLVSLS